jgi:hypothetical protein
VPLTLIVLFSEGELTVDRYQKFAAGSLVQHIGDETVTGAFVFYGEPVYANLEWMTTEHTKPTEEEFEAGVTALENAEPLKMLRMVRDGMLKQTDHWALSDTATATQAQLDYRQALRDITTSATSLDDVTWPEKPA